ncbi:MAG: hypothetical protein HRU70_00795 [Phycisphaeraceae bacterium]|nr:MAG: hypothetical protein HRU70_00795 [Phycisphaeraceae bacterium]
MSRRNATPTILLAAAAAAVAALPAHAQSLSVHFNTPSLDRWMYPFNSTPGIETSAPLFGAILQPGFDDRDAQFLVGFDTQSTIPPGLPLDHYDILSITITLAVGNNNVALYDPTPDSVRTLFPDTDPLHLPDADPGKPIELFGVAYRNGFSASTFLESTRFGGAPLVPPAEGARNAFAAVFDDQGNPTDVSRQVRLRPDGQPFEATPFAVGLTDQVEPGQPIPAGTVMTFTLSRCDPAARAYLARGLAEGRLRFIASSLEPASGDPGGGTGDPTYPTIITREAGLGLEATLALNVRVGLPADFNADGFVDFFDFADFVDAFEDGDTAADFNADCFVDFFDLDAFLEAFEA